MVDKIAKEQATSIFKEYSSYVFQTALLLTNSRTLADDITQETFIQVFKKFYTFDSTKSVKPWIYKVTLNISRNIIRKQKWLKFTGNIPDTIDKYNVEEDILKNEEDMELWQEIIKLPLKSKELIVLHFYAGLKLKEIADILNIPIGTCKSRLNTALKTLRKNMPIEFNNGGDNVETI